MASQLDPVLVRHIFKGLETGDTASFMSYIAEDVRWTVTNPDPASKSHPLAGLYQSRQTFQDETLKRLANVLHEPLRLIVHKEPIIGGDWAVVELRAETPDGKVLYGKNGARFDNRYAWVIHWDPSQSKIVEVRAYLDTALVVNVFKDE